MIPLQVTKFGNLWPMESRLVTAQVYQITGIKMWRRMDTVPEYNTIKEYNRVASGISSQSAIDTWDWHHYDGTVTALAKVKICG